MKKSKFDTDQYKYTVSPGEVVSIRITSQSIPNLVSAALDGNHLSQEGDTFRFNVSRPRDEFHEVALAFDFPPDAPESAKYDVELTGSGGGSYSWSVQKTDYTIVRLISFFIGDTGPK